MLAGLLCFVCASCVNPGGSLSPLIVAARTGDTTRIAELIASGADVNERGGVNDWTPLMHAIHKNQAGSVKALLDGHADVSATAGREDALTMAAAYGYADIVTLLLDHGVIASRAALAAAVGGSTDIDRLTVGHCQADTVKVLLARDPLLTTTEHPHCAEIAVMLNRPH